MNYKKLVSNLPQSPGVYFFKNISKKTIYVGKATNLKSRVSSYFANDILEKRGPIIQKMVSEICHIDFIKTDTVLEALILEANEIKKQKPKYNTKEKSDKSFSYLIITDEKYPSVLIKRQKDVLENKIKEKVKYSFGPFQSRRALEQILKIVRKFFPFYTSKKSYNQKSNLYRQIGLLPNISITQKEYKENILNIKYFFEGKKKTILKNLKKKMQDFAKKQEFEKAQEIKNKIFLLEHIKDINIIDDKQDNYFSQNFRIEAYDISHFQGKNQTGVMTVLENSEVLKSEYRKFNIKSFEGINDPKALYEVFSRRLKHTEWKLPDLIVVDGSFAQKRVFHKALKENKISKEIKVVACVKNKKHQVQKFIGDKKIISKYQKDILLANAESHRFALSVHKQKRNKNFLKK
ncbi:hypothetical protein CSB11_03050 [Candidatus Campbellbacteria bacterium]|nr:MAG: hypothetical protein CSB11_03050 [Candidatus Campbellbacteria bacterium]